MPGRRVVVLGAGVSGCAAAILLCRRGYSVTVVERQRFPRFSIGESISPAAVNVINKLGIDCRQLDGAFQRKLGTQVYCRGQQATFDACNGLNKRDWPSYSYNVERSRFDQLLLQQAKNGGAQVIMPAQALEVNTESNQVCLQNGSERQSLDYDFLVDATGYHSPLVEELQLRRFAREEKSVAVFAHFHGNLSYRTISPFHLSAYIQPPSRWIWVIPLSQDKVSVGVVDAVNQIDKAGFFDCIKATPIDTLIESSEIQFIQGRSVNDYCASRYCGSNYFLVGDSAFFVDPIFSSGVTAALKASEFLVEQVLSENNAVARMHRYNAFMQDYYGAIKRQVDLFYEAIKHPLLVRETLRWWNLFEHAPLLRRMQDWGNGAFNEHQLLLGLWSSAGRRLGRALSHLGQ